MLVYATRDEARQLECNIYLKAIKRQLKLWWKNNKNKTQKVLSSKCSLVFIGEALKCSQPKCTDNSTIYIIHKININSCVSYYCTMPINAHL